VIAVFDILGIFKLIYHNGFTVLYQIALLDFIKENM